MPLTTSNLVLSRIYPMSISPFFDLLLSFIGGMPLYMYLFGYFKQFNVHRYSWTRFVASAVEIALASTLRWIRAPLQLFLLPSSSTRKQT